MLDFLTA